MDCQIWILSRLAALWRSLVIIKRALDSKTGWVGWGICLILEFS